MIEHTLQYGTTYQQGEVKKNQGLSLPIPHRAACALTIARPIAGKIRWINAQENDNVIVYATKSN